MGYTHLEAGRLFEITAYEHFQSGKEGFAELVKLPPEQLEELKKASAAKEKEIFGRICASTGEWHEQAQQTQQYQKAQEYARMLPVKHTGNQMQKGEYDWYEISNIVYRLTWREYEQTRYDRGLQKSVTCAWELSWYLNYNTPRNPDDTSGGRIAGQERKHFSDHAALEKYLQGRHQSLRPPVHGAVPAHPGGTSKAVLRQRLAPPRLYRRGTPADAAGAARLPGGTGYTAATGGRKG